MLRYTGTYNLFVIMGIDSAPTNPDRANEESKLIDQVMNAFMQAKQNLSTEEAADSVVDQLLNESPNKLKAAFRELLIAKIK